MRETEETALRGEHLDLAPAPPRLVDEDARVDVQGLLRRLAGEERFVDYVLALQHDDRDPLKAQLLVECDRLLVVVHDRQIDEEPAARRIMLDGLAHERLADARMPGVWMDGEAPQAGTAFRVVERLDMVDAGDGAGNGAGGHVFGDDNSQ